MTTQIDWQGALERAIEPIPDRATGEYVAAGHRAARRRRTTVAVAGLASAVVLGGVAWAVVPGGGPARTESTVASQGPSPTATEAPDAQLSEGPWPADAPPVRAIPGIGLQIRPGSVVHERRDDLYSGKDTESAALDVTYAQRRWWVVIEWNDSGSNVQSADPESAGGTFASYVAEAVGDGGMFQMPADPVQDQFPLAGLAAWSSDGLELRDGVTLVRRVDDPHGLEPPATSLGLVLEHRGTTTWVSAIREGSGTSISSMDAADSGWLTFDQWLAEEVALQAGEPGLRLVTMDEGGDLRAHEPGVEIVDTLDTLGEPDLADYVGRSAAASAVAELTWRGATWFVLVVRDRGQDHLTTVAADKAGGVASIDEFLDHMRRAVEGGGMR